MRIVILGASGNAGREIARMLATELGPNDELRLVGRNEAKLAATLADVRSRSEAAGRGVAAHIAMADLTKPSAITEAIAGARLVVMAASQPRHVAAIASATIDAGADWIDTLLSGAIKLRALRDLAPRIVERGLCFVTDGGFHPGLPATLARWAGTRISHIERADIFAALRIDWKVGTLAPSTLEEFLDEFLDFDLATYIDRTKRPLRASEFPRVDFGRPIGSKVCVPMPLDEMEALPLLYPSLKRTGFYIAGFNPLMDYAVLPAITLLARTRRLRPLAVRLMTLSMAHLASYPPPHALVIRLIAEGRHQANPTRMQVTIRGDDSYRMTAAPAVACIRRILDGSARRPGLWHQAHLVDPDTCFADLRSLGIGVTIEST